MDSKKEKFYEKTWFCIVMYFIFFPLGLFLALRNDKISKDVKNLLKAGVVLIIILYGCIAGRLLKIGDPYAKKESAKKDSEAAEVVNREEFKKQGDSTIRNIESLLKKYKASVSSEDAESADSENKESTEASEKSESTVVSSGNKVKVSGDPYEYNVSYNTETEGDNGKVNLLISVKYPNQCVLDFKNSSFMKDVITAFEGDNVDFDSFNSWTQKSEENYSGKKAINSSVYSRKISDLEETLNFNTGKEGLMQVNLVKNVTVK